MGIIERMKSTFSLQDPTGQWQRTPDLGLQIDLQQPTLNGVELRRRLDILSFLGPAEERDEGEFGYPSLGLSLDSIDFETFTGFQVVHSDPDYRPNYAPYPGECRFGNQPLVLADVTEPLLRDAMGEPYWRDEDDAEVILFYEYPYHELQIELTREGRLQCIGITSFPLMANQEQREAYGVTQAWPPTNT